MKILNYEHQLNWAECGDPKPRRVIWITPKTTEELVFLKEMCKGIDGMGMTGVDSDMAILYAYDNAEHAKPYPSETPSLKPPMGLTPKWVREEERIKEVREAIMRYYNSRKKIPIEWIEEYNSLTNTVE